MANAGTARAPTNFTRAEVVKIADHGGESWLEKQIETDPALLGLDGVRVVSTQVTHKAAGRLDILAKDVENEVAYAIEIMLGQLDASHLVRAIDYWLREKARPDVQDWETVAVVAAEDVRGSRYCKVAKFLSESMPLIVIEMKAHKVGNQLTLISMPLFDGTASIDSASVDIEPQEKMGAESWCEKSSVSSVQVVAGCGKILKKISAGIAVNLGNRNFIGVTVGNRARNFLVFKPKRNWVRVHARFLPETEKWGKKLTKAGLPIVGGKPGRSLHFRLTKSELKKNSALLRLLFTECYKNRTGQKASD